eukprot:258202_1
MIIITPTMKQITPITAGLVSRDRRAIRFKTLSDRTSFLKVQYCVATIHIMSRQDLLVHHVSTMIDRFNETDEEITDILVSYGISKEEISTIFNICRYKSTTEIPDQWISELLHFVTYYSVSGHSDPSEIRQKYLNRVLEYLSGADLVSLEIALSRKGTKVIEDFCHQFILHNPVMDTILNIDDMLNFPANQDGHNWKFLYHLLYAPPDAHLVGGPYSRSTPSGMEPKTCIALFHHRQYLTEKVLKGGGLALCLNVFNRIIINPQYAFPPPKPVVSPFSFSLNFDHYSCRSISDHLKYLYRIPDRRLSDDLWDMFNYFAPIYLRGGGYIEAYHELFQKEMNYRLNEDDDEYDRLFRQFMDTMKYQAMEKFVRIFRPRLRKYAWDWHLTSHLGLVAAYGNAKSAKILMRMGAKVNLDGKIKNRKTCDVITESLEGRGGVPVLIAIFNSVTEHNEEFTNEDAKVTSNQITAIFERYYSATHDQLRKLKYIFMTKKYLLTTSAQSRLSAYQL